MSEQNLPRNPEPRSPQGTNPAVQQPEAVRPQPVQPAAQNSGSSWAWGEAQPGQPQDSRTLNNHNPLNSPSQSSHSPIDQAGQNAQAGWGVPASGPTASFGAGWGTPAGTASGPQAGDSSGWGSTQAGNDKAGLQGRWSLKRTLIVAGVAVAVAAGTAAGFYSLGNAGSADAANVPSGLAGGLGGQQGQGVPGQGLGPGGTGQNGTGQNGTGQNGSGQGGLGQGMPGQMGGMAPGGLGGGLNAAIHSEYVILRDNEYVTMADQLGVVSEVSSNSLTVKSADGFSRTYNLDSDTAVAQGTRQRGSTSGSLTVADIKSGATVRVTASKSGENYTATSVRLTAATSSGEGSSVQGPTSGSGTTS
ncbi:hypothetical protein ACIPY2_11450 [Paenarthrobacter sp. NPDC089675]|uniref:hypothetical protein n=1 Tax=Paenarthrobacter sp. NPDC089675 TaxID=3364376 RepID=UPI0037F8ADA6